MWTLFCGADRAYVCLQIFTQVHLEAHSYPVAVLILLLAQQAHKVESSSWHLISGIDGGGAVPADLEGTRGQPSRPSACW